MLFLQYISIFHFSLCLGLLGKNIHIRAMQDYSPYCADLVKITSLCNEVFIHILCPQTCHLESQSKILFTKGCEIKQYCFSKLMIILSAVLVLCRLFSSIMDTVVTLLFIHILALFIHIIHLINELIYSNNRSSCSDVVLQISENSQENASVGISFK